ncbi:MAG: NAD(P)-dependent oxidoreductase, partial [Oscillospiraceae bacterium]|nr:NAD(P)-dependent oxidoreductase [Oscillospiraceae bacterium]
MKIGMAGLGVMGHSVAENLIRHGFDMVLYDIRPEAMTDLVEAGAEAVDSLEALGSAADTILLMVNTYDQYKSVLAGILKTMHAGTLINLGTLGRDHVLELEKQAEEAGISMLDCPVSGGSRGAKAGTLTVMASGPDELFEKHKKILEAFGSRVIHVGKNVGDGQAVKAINQLLVGVHMCATAEAFTVARKCGLDLQTVYDTICSSAGMSRIFENRGEFLIARDFSTRSTLEIQLKDTDIACKTADAVGAPVLL